MIFQRMKPFKDLTNTALTVLLLACAVVIVAIALGTKNVPLKAAALAYVALP